MDEIIQAVENDKDDPGDPVKIRPYIEGFHEFCTGDQSCRNAITEIMECRYANPGNSEQCWQR